MTSLNGSNLENLLKADSILIQYFNQFLNLGIFNQKVQWNNHKKTFELKGVTLHHENLNRQQESASARVKLQSRVSSTRKLHSRARCYSTRVKHVTRWIVKERLPFFVNSKLHRTYKFFDEITSTTKALEKQDLSDGNNLDENRKTIPSTPTQHSTRASPLITNCVKYSKTSNLPSLVPTAKNRITVKRSQSFPMISNNKQLFEPNNNTNDNTFGGNYVTGENGRSNEPSMMSRPESVLEFNTEGRNYKDGDDLHIAPTPEMMSDERQSFMEEWKRKDFLEFLSCREISKKLLKLWMAIEEYFDQNNDATANSSSIRDRVKIKERQLWITRYIQQSFSNYLTDNAKVFINRTRRENNDDFNDYFLQAQKDVIDRIKGYWLTRYNLHLQFGKRSTCPCVTQIQHEWIFQEFNFVQSLPPLGNEVPNLETKKSNMKTKDYEFHDSNDSVQDGQNITLVFKKALQQDRECGGVFQSWLKRLHFQKIDKLMILLDFQSLIEDVEKIEDRLLNLCAAWKFFQKYFHIQNGNQHPAVDIATIHNKLSTTDLVSKKFLEDAFSKVIEGMTKEVEFLWEEFFKQDVFVEPISEIIDPLIEVNLCESRVSIKMDGCDGNDTNKRGMFTQSSRKRLPSGRWVPRHPGSSTSERRNRLMTALTIAERCSAIRDRGILTSRSRHQLYGSTTKDHEDILKRSTRRRFNNDDGGMSSDEDDGEIDMMESTDDEGDGEVEDFLDNVDNTEVMSNFKAFIQDNEGRGMMNDLLMYLEIEYYFSLFGPRKNAQKHSNATAIFKTFFEKASRKSVELPSFLLSTVKEERPTSSLMREAQQFVLPQLSTCFDSYVTYMQHYNRNGIEGNTLIADKVPLTAATSTISQHEIDKRWKDALNANKFVKELKKKKPGNGTTSRKWRDNNQQFLKITSNLFSKKNKQTFEKFHEYLLRCEEKGFPRAGKNLLFFAEVIKFKEVYPYMDEHLLNKKAEVIVDVFLDSASPPWLQVNVSPEVASRISQRVQHSTTQKFHSSVSKHQHVDSNIFNEAHDMVLKEILPLWNAFLKSSDQQNRTITGSGEHPESNGREKRKQKMLNNTMDHRGNYIEPVIIEAPKTTNNHPSNNFLSFSLLNGYAWKDGTIRRKKSKLIQYEKIFGKQF